MARWRDRREDADLQRRIPVLVVGMLLMGREAWQYFDRSLRPQIERIARIGQSDKIDALVFFDALTLIAVLCGIFFAVALVLGHPEKERGRRGVLRGHPVRTLAILAPLMTAALVFAPTVIYDALFTFDTGFIPDAHWLWPDPRYVEAAVTAGLGLAIYLADAQAPRGVLHWWMWPFPILSTARLDALPLLGFAAVATLIPSRLWTPFRVVFPAAVCALPVLAYPTSQPIRSIFALPAHNLRADESLPLTHFKNAYEATVAPNGDALYLTAGNTLNKYTRTGDGSWRPATSWSADFEWDVTAYDFARGDAYVLQSPGGRLFQIHLDTMHTRATRNIDISDFPTRSHLTRMIVDPTRDLLLAVSRNGAMFTYRLDTQEVASTRSLSHASRIFDMDLDAVRGEVYILFARTLFVLDMDTLQTRRVLQTQNPIGGLAVDPATRRCYATRPDALEILVLDCETFEQITTFPAPAGIRVVEWDRERHHLLSGSLTGVVATHDPATGEMTRRRRLTPWVHWLTPLEDGRTVVTFGENPPRIWDPTAPSEFDPFDSALRIFSWAYRTFASPPPLDSEVHGRILNAVTSLSPCTAVHFDPNDATAEIARIYLEQAGCEVRRIAALEKLSDVGDDVDFALVAPTDWDETTLNLARDWSTARHRPVVFAGSSDSPCVAMFGEKCVSRPVAKNQLLSIVAWELGRRSGRGGEDLPGSTIGLDSAP